MDHLGYGLLKGRVRSRQTCRTCLKNNLGWWIVPSLSLNHPPTCSQPTNQRTHQPTSQPANLRILLREVYNTYIILYKVKERIRYHRVVRVPTQRPSDQRICAWILAAATFAGPVSEAEAVDPRIRLRLKWPNVWGRVRVSILVYKCVYICIYIYDSYETVLNWRMGFQTKL